jgi:hypothetical protein
MRQKIISLGELGLTSTLYPLLALQECARIGAANVGLARLRTTPRGSAALVGCLTFGGVFLGLTREFAWDSLASSFAAYAVGGVVSVAIRGLIGLLAGPP